MRPREQLQAELDEAQDRLDTVVNRALGNFPELDEKAS